MRPSVCVSIPTWNRRTQLFLIIQRSGLVARGRYPFTEPVLSIALFLPNGWAAEPGGQAGQGRLQAPRQRLLFLICVPLEQTFTPLWPHLTPCHSAAKWGNHARGDCNFGLGLNTSPTLDPCSLCLFTKQTQGFTLSPPLVTQRNIVRTGGEMVLYLSASGMDGRCGAALPCCKGLSHWVVCYYRSSLKSWRAMDSKEWINHDIKLLCNTKLYHLITTALGLLSTDSLRIRQVCKNNTQLGKYKDITEEIGVSKHHHRGHTVCTPSYNICTCHFYHRLISEVGIEECLWEQTKEHQGLFWW